MGVNGDTGEVTTNIELLITTKLLHEGFNCPIAFVELVRQYGELDETQRAGWVNGLSGAQAAGLYFAGAMHSEGLGGLMMVMVLDLDTDAANELVNALMARIGEAFEIDASEGADVPTFVREAVEQYLDENGLGD